LTRTRHLRNRVLQLFLTAALALAAAAVPSPSAAQSGAPLLDVPYLPQSEALCGGAAIAMVMRYWGTTAVYAETFADLVDPEAAGIRGRDLIGALESRGFDVTSFEGDAARIHAALAKRYPPVVLIEDRPGRFHYVVIVGWRGDRVIVHDPARAPFRVIAADAFLRAWSVSGYWTLLAGPGTTAPEPVLTTSAVESRLPTDAPRAATSVCGGLVEEGIRLAGAGDLASAERVLAVAAADCGHAAAPWRELAGVHALRADWKAAAADARRALERESTDQHAARILATSLFLSGEEDAALDAWNRIGAPVLDIIDIQGLERTRFAVAAAALDLEPQTILTREKLVRARRRLSAMPSVMGSRVVYEPGEDERARVRAAILERPLVPRGLLPLAAAGLRAASDRELALAVASPTGGGELWRASWRWWERRPRAAFGLVAPSPFGGIWSVEAFAERQTYGAASEISQRRTGVALAASDWVSGNVNIEGRGMLDRWDEGSTAAFQGVISAMFDSGRGRVSADAGMMAGAYRSGLMSADAMWRSSDARQGTSWHGRAGLSIVGANAPLALWPGAGTGHGRDALLRAHPLLHEGAIRGVFGRRLGHAGLEWRRWRGPVFRMVHVAPAIFVDAARAFGVPAYGDARMHVDAGAGIRMSIPGAGVLRVDVAKGLRDGSTAWSMGWVR
jgi:hypothetical protein